MSRIPPQMKNRIMVLFRTLNDNSTKNVAEYSGFTEHQVHTVINNHYKEKTKHLNV